MVNRAVIVDVCIAYRTAQRYQADNVTRWLGNVTVSLGDVGVKKRCGVKKRKNCGVKIVKIAENSRKGKKGQKGKKGYTRRGIRAERPEY